MEIWQTHYVSKLSHPDFLDVYAAISMLLFLSLSLCMFVINSVELEPLVQYTTQKAGLGHPGIEG